jgi:ketosteroid isomerase-like protein
MKRLFGALLAGLVMASATHAEEWQTYTYPEPGFAIQFPGVPDVQTTKLKNSIGLTLPVTRYVVRGDGVQYTLSVVDYSSTNADSLSTIGEATKSFGAKGKVNANTGARVNGNHGRQLTITESDGSRSDIAIFFVNNHLYTAVGQALPPNVMERSADTARFQQSLQFPRDDSGFLGMFGGGSRTSSKVAASSIGSGGSVSSMSSGSDDARQVIVRLEQQLTDALSRSDSRTVDALWADDLVWVGPNGRTSSKAEQLAGMGSAATPGTPAALTATNKKVDVRIYGTTAVVTVTSTWVNTQAQTPSKDMDYVATHVWNHTGGGWRLVAAHISRLVPR